MKTSTWIKTLSTWDPLPTTLRPNVATYFEYLGLEPMDFEMCVGSDDSVQVWIDAHMALNNNDCRGSGKDSKGAISKNQAPRV